MGIATLNDEDMIDEAGEFTPDDPQERYTVDIYVHPTHNTPSRYTIELGYYYTQSGKRLPAAKLYYQRYITAKTDKTPFGDLKVTGVLSTDKLWPVVKMYDTHTDNKIVLLKEYIRCTTSPRTE